MNEIRKKVLTKREMLMALARRREKRPTLLRKTSALEAGSTGHWQKSQAA
jgi:hypothetical protein